MMCLIRRSFLPSKNRLRSAGINSFCPSRSGCKVFASLTHSPNLLLLLFTTSTLDMDAISTQAALTSVRRPEQLEKGCPTCTARFGNCSGVQLIPKTQSAHSSVVAKLSKNQKKVALQTRASLWHFKKRIPIPHRVHRPLHIRQLSQRGCTLKCKFEKTAFSPLFNGLSQQLTSTWDEKPLLATLYVDTFGQKLLYHCKKEALEGTLDRTSTWENSGPRCIVIA